MSSEPKPEEAFLKDHSWICQYCEYERTFKSRSGLRKHITVQHPNKVEVSRLPSHWRTGEYAALSDEMKARIRKNQKKEYRERVKYRKLHDEALQALIEKHHETVARPTPPEPLLTDPPIRPESNIYSILDICGKTDWIANLKGKKLPKHVQSKISRLLGDHDGALMRGGIDAAHLLANYERTVQAPDFELRNDIELGKQYVAQREEYAKLRSEHEEKTKEFHAALHEWENPSISEYDVNNFILK